MSISLQCAALKTSDATLPNMGSQHFQYNKSTTTKSPPEARHFM